MYSRRLSSQHEEVSVMNVTINALRIVKFVRLTMGYDYWSKCHFICILSMNAHFDPYIKKILAVCVVQGLLTLKHLLSEMSLRQ